MTVVYFIRHAQPDLNIHEDLTRPLTQKGLDDAKRLAQYLSDKGISQVFSSPCKRAYDTVLPFAQCKRVAITLVNGFTERRISDTWIQDFSSFCKRQWQDFDFKLPHGESLAQVQARNISALTPLLHSHSGTTFAVGTHGTALSTIINYYDPSFGYESFCSIAGLMPWVVRIVFKGTDCISIDTIDLLRQPQWQENPLV